MLMKFYERKANEIRNPMKPKSNDLDLRLGRNPCLKINKNLHPNLGKTMKNFISKMKLLV